METIYADHTVSISEFKISPARKVSEAGGRPVAVLVNNRPDFYAVPAALFAQIADILNDLMMGETVRQRVESGDFIEVDPEDL